MKAVFSARLLILIVLMSFSFKTKNTKVPTEDSILWNSNRKLTWNDFQGKPDEKNTHKAVTTTSIECKANIFSDSVVDYNITCLFQKKESWKRVQSANLLNHEQLHFDIAELATRKLRKEYMAYKFTSLDSINPMINRIFKRALITRINLNDQYDKETNHGTILEKQKIWQIKIAKELKELDRYAKTRVVIKRIKSKQ